jgi:tetratricopeptide (TPR) repeat protein
MKGSELLAAGERAETAGDYLSAAAAYRSVAEQSDAVLAAEAYFRLGRVTWRQGRFDAAVGAFESARALAEHANAEELLARVQNGIGAVHYARGDYSAARRAYADASARTADDTMRGKIILNLGVIENIEGNLDAAREHYERAYLLFQETGDDGSAMLALHNRGMVEADLARWDDADASFLAALACATERGDVEMIAKTLVNRSEVLLHHGALREAIEHCDRALRMYSDIGDEVGRGEALRWRARALARDGETMAAERNAGEALQIAMRAGARLLEAEAARDLGELRRLLGDRAGGTRLLERAEALFVELGARREAAEVGELLRRGW